MEREIHPPEWLLDQLYDVGQRWMAARARERGTGPPSDWGKGDRPPSAIDPRAQERVVYEAVELRKQFESLVREFIDRVEEL